MSDDSFITNDVSEADDDSFISNDSIRSRSPLLSNGSLQSIPEEINPTATISEDSLSNLSEYNYTASRLVAASSIEPLNVFSSRNSSYDLQLTDNSSGGGLSEADEVSDDDNGLETEYETASNVEFSELQPEFVGTLVRIQRQEILSSLLYLWAIVSGVSDAALDRFLKLMIIVQRNFTWPSSFKSLKTSIHKFFLRDVTDFSIESFHICPLCMGNECAIASHDKNHVFIPSLERQITSLISSKLSTIRKYESHLRQNIGIDVLCGEYARRNNFLIESNDLHLHLLVCADGANYVKSTDKSFWPIQAQVLNLPPVERQKFTNCVLIALVEACKKPYFDYVIPRLFETIPQSVNVDGIEIKLHFSFFTADLPAMAYMCGIHQFNGAFSCPKCLHPGESLQVSQRGYVRCFPRQDTVLPSRSVQNYQLHAALAESSGQTVFGVRKKAPLSSIIPFPDGYIIDPMHCIFEGQVKQVLQDMIAASRNQECYFSPIATKWTEEVVSLSKGPKGYVIPPPISKLNMWKAKHFRNFFLNMAIPIVANAASGTHLKLFLISLSMLYNLLFHHSSPMVSIQYLTQIVLEKLPCIFGNRSVRLNFHLLNHFPASYREFGPISNVSMFGFESAIGKYEQLMKGTNGFGSQIVTKFAVSKEVFMSLTSMQSADVDEALAVITLQPQEKSMYCTLEDDAYRKTVNSFVLRRDGKVGMIESISDEEVTLELIKPVLSGGLFDVDESSLADDERTWITRLRDIHESHFLIFGNIYDIRKRGEHDDCSIYDLVAPLLMIPARKMDHSLYYLVPVYAFMHD